MATTKINIEAMACIIYDIALLKVTSISHKRTFSHPVERRDIENLQWKMPNVGESSMLRTKLHNKQTAFEREG